MEVITIYNGNILKATHTQCCIIIFIISIMQFIKVIQNDLINIYFF